MQNTITHIGKIFIGIFLGGVVLSLIFLTGVWILLPLIFDNTSRILELSLSPYLIVFLPGVFILGCSSVFTWIFGKYVEGKDMQIARGIYVSIFLVSIIILLVVMYYAGSIYGTNDV